MHYRCNNIVTHHKDSALTYKSLLFGLEFSDDDDESDLRYFRVCFGGLEPRCGSLAAHCSQQVILNYQRGGGVELLMPI